MALTHEMFALSLPILEKILRPIIVYAFLVFLLRVFGKRELAQLNPFDLVVLLSLSNTVQNAIIGNDNSVTGGIIGAATLLVLNYVVVWYLYDHEKLDELIEGRLQGNVLMFREPVRSRLEPCDEPDEPPPHLVEEPPQARVVIRLF